MTFGAAALMAGCAGAAVLLALPRATTLASMPRHGDPGGRDRQRFLPAATGLASALAATLLVGGSVGLVVGPLVGLAAAVAVHRLEPPTVRRRREAVERGLPQTVDLLAACLAAGRAPGQALDEVAGVLRGPIRDELIGVSARLRLGVDPVTVWGELARHPQLGSLGRCVLRAVDSGASVADAMVRLADDLRRDTRAAVEARARAVGVRAALPLGVCLLPAFVLLGVVPLVAGSLAAISLR